MGTGRLAGGGTNRVFRLPPPPRRAGQMGRPVKHGAELPLAADAARPEPDAVTTTVTSRYGAAAALSWNRAHPKLKARGAWEGHQGALPVIEGTLIRLTVDHLPHDRAPKPVWLRASRPDAGPAEADLCWQAFLRRFDLEHMNVPQAVPGLDPPEAPRSGRRRPLDLARPGRLRPALARPPPGRR